MQLKRFFAILLAATLIFSVAAVPASAENTEILKVGVVAETTAPISTSPLIVNQGEEVSVKVSVEENTGVNFLRFALYFDADAFEYVSHTSSDLLGSGSVQVKNDYLIFFATGETVSVKTGELFTVTFVAKEFCGDAEFTAELAQGRESNCCKLGQGSSKVNVPFVSEDAQVKVHSIDAEEGVVTAPTCEGEGYTTYTCKACEQTVVGNVVDPTGHTPGKWAIENKIDATCTELGSYDEVQYCDVCFAELVRNPVEVPAFGHTAGEAVEENRVEATCTTDGSYDVVVYCSVCGEELSRETIVVPATGHTAGEAVEENRVEATCTTDGSYDVVVYCTVCGEELSRETIVVPATGHTAGEAVEENRVEATCTTDGSYDVVVYCTTCNAEISRETIVVPATGHTAGEAVEENRVETTCTTDGSYDVVVYCTVCNAEISRETIVVPATGHTAGESVEENRVEATCTTDGSYDVVVYCTTCNAEISRETVVITATGHSFGETVIVPPTGSTEGYSEHTCEVCGFSEKFDFVPVLNYVVSGTITSYLADGDVTIKLALEGLVIYSTTVNGSVVDYSIEGVEPGTYTMTVSKENHISYSCEIVVTDADLVADVEIFPLGDVTGDGVVNIKDFQRLLRHVNKTNPLSDYALSCGDVTGDGVCNIKDFQRLLRHVNKTNPLF